MSGSISHLVQAHSDIIALALLALVLILVIVQVIQGSRLAHLNRVYTRLTKGTSGGNLEEILQSHIATVEAVSQRLETLTSEVERIANQQKRCLQRVGLVRFDAFEDVGGEQSFAVALMDDTGNGVTISSMYSRNDVRVYAKEIREGQPSHPLSTEELRARSIAQGG